MLLKKDKSELFLKLLILSLITLIKQNPINENLTYYYSTSLIFGLYSCSPGEEICSSLGNICFPASQCPTPMSCSENLKKINSYSCAVDDIFRPQSQCSTNKECWDNTCVDNEEDRKTLCPSMFSCPNSYPVKCSDNSCVDNTKDCPNYFDCPQFLPIRCPNGDCRQSLEDCPSLITCPISLPVQCNDWSCHLIKDNCKYCSVESQCSEKSMVRCSDGTCSSSKFLCPTSMTCPKGYEKCWNGKCEIKGKCKLPDGGSSSTCNIEGKVLCIFDFSCRNEIISCPTGIICPADRPVRCWDNSCKENINQCPLYQNCPFGMIDCPDGSCAIKECGTHITCSSEAPYRCYDNTCRINPEDCPSIPLCPKEKPILCWDGRCLSKRGECRSPSPCDSSSPVKCPNGLCYYSGKSCKPIDDCPAEFGKCPDGTCMKSIKFCNMQSCPLNFPFKCRNGMCVSNLSYCENDKGCPWNKPEKCFNGKCVSEKKDCGTEENCEDGKKRCPDGSCLPLLMACPSESGCPFDTPIKCADGTCIKDDGKETCPIPSCPSSQPYRCLNGFCAKTISSCPYEYKNSEENKSLVICADSTLAHYYDECKPIFECSGFETVRCGDGSCRSEKTSCPLEDNKSFLDTCPSGTFRCNSGICSSLEGECLLNNGCHNTTEKKYKCRSNGACVRNETECVELDLTFNLPNGCTREYPIKCSKTGKCVSTDNECLILDNGCDDEQIMCSNGECGTKERCFEIDDYECKNETGRGFTCPFTSAAVCGENFGSCYTKENCLMNTPFRCINGECKRYPYNLGKIDNNSCDIGIKCPDYKPFLCLDGSCVENTAFCKSTESCPPEKKYLCFDRTCSSSQEECINKHKKCPGLNPILCPNGNCVSDIFDCSDFSCPSWLPFKCLTGECTTIPSECTLQETKYEIDEKGEEIELRKFGSICREDEFQCYDGTCRLDFKECPIFPGCSSLSKPFKCPNGSCAISKENCEGNLEKISSICYNGTQLCNDGICRKFCFDTNGCPNNKPLMCSTGHCVTSIPECVADSSCISSENIFRCVDGSCVASLNSCKSILREYGTTNIIISTYPNIKINIPIVIGENNLIISSIYIPSDIFISNNTSVQSKVIVQSIPKSYCNFTYTIYDETRYEDILAVYPYADINKDFKLNYEYSILSTVVNITADKTYKNEEIIWNNNIILTLLYDFPYKHEGIQSKIWLDSFENSRNNNMPLDSLKDICLGKLNEAEGLWKCVDLSQKAVFLDNFELEASLNSSGIYAVILAPRRNATPLNVKSNFFIEHLLSLSIIIIIIFLVIGIGIYVFKRVYRYRRKYKKTKRVYKETEIEFKDMSFMQSQMQGETIADHEEGVLFTDNPTYQKKKIDDSSNVRHLENMYEKFVKKLKTLERNNKTLLEKTENIKNEIKRLNEYKDELSKTL